MTLTVRALYDALEEKYPRSLSCPWDNDGLSICPDPDAPVTGVMIALDATEDTLAAAVDAGFNVVLTHHPMLFRGLSAVDGCDTGSRKVIAAVRVGVACMAFHTRLDAAPGGVNDTLASALGLEDVTPFGGADNPAGAPIGRIGSLPEPESFEAFTGRVKTALHLPAVLCAGPGTPVSRVAVLGGAGDDDVGAAVAAGADAYVTGELHYYQLCDAPFGGIALYAAGHYHTEFPVTAVLARDVAEIAARYDTAVPACVIGSCRVGLR